MATTDCPVVVWRNTLRRPRTSIGGGPLCMSWPPPQQPRFDPRHHGFEQEQQRHQHQVQANTSATENNSCATDN